MLIFKFHADLCTASFDVNNANLLNGSVKHETYCLAYAGVTHHCQDDVAEL